MNAVNQRDALERLIRDRREDYASLSRLIGKNAAYIQQFIKRGVPKRLQEEDRRILARYFSISETELGAPADAREPAQPEDRFVPVPRLDVGASAGAGAADADESATAHIGFEKKFLRGLSRGKPTDLSLIRVQGDSMTPALSDGDDILVDAGDAGDRLRDGIYVLRRDDALLVKRIAPNPASRRIAIKSDNDAYPDWPDCEIGYIEIIGRGVWAGRRIY